MVYVEGGRAGYPWLINYFVGDFRGESSPIRFRDGQNVNVATRSDYIHYTTDVFEATFSDATTPDGDYIGEVEVYAHEAVFSFNSEEVTATVPEVLRSLLSELTLEDTRSIVTELRDNFEPRDEGIRALYHALNIFTA